jgi:hypothetical protein
MKESRDDGRRRGLAGAALAIVLAALAGCGTRQVQVQTVMPAPLVVRIPVVVGLYLPPEFRTAVHTEKRDGVEYAIDIGAAQSGGVQRLMDAMFTRAVAVAAPTAAAATDPEIRGVFEPVLEDLSFVTPTDTGTPLYAVSLKYRINAYRPNGELVDSWTFTGYGTQPAAQLPGQGRTLLQQAAAAAMRDAGAKIAVEFREQAIVRGLIEPSGETTPRELQPPP